MKIKLFGMTEPKISKPDYDVIDWRMGFEAGNSTLEDIFSQINNIINEERVKFPAFELKEIRCETQGLKTIPLEDSNDEKSSDI